VVGGSTGRRGFDLHQVSGLVFPDSRFPIPSPRIPIPEYRKKIRLCWSKVNFFAPASECDLRAFAPIRLVLFNFFSKRDPERFAVLLNSEKGIVKLPSI